MIFDTCKNERRIKPLNCQRRSRIPVAKSVEESLAQMLADS